MARPPKPPEILTRKQLAAKPTKPKSVVKVANKDKRDKKA